MQETNSEVFLFGALLNTILNIDYPAMAEYAIRAAIGGVIYFMFKLVADFISEKYFTKTVKRRRHE